MNRRLRHKSKREMMSFERRRCHCPALAWLALLLGCLSAASASPADVSGIERRLNSSSPLERMQALSEISEGTNSRFSDAVVTALQDTDEQVRSAAVSALGVTPSSSWAKLALVQALSEDHSQIVRMKAACELARSYPADAVIPLLRRFALEVDSGRDINEALNNTSRSRSRLGMDCPADRDPDSEVRLIVGQLFQLSKRVDDPRLSRFLLDERPQMRWIAAQMLAASSPAARNLAIRGVREADPALVAGTHEILIGLGRSESIPVLLDALEAHGTPSMAGAYLSSGRPELVDAAKRWAESRGHVGFTSSRRPSMVWGSSNTRGE